MVIYNNLRVGTNPYTYPKLSSPIPIPTLLLPVYPITVKDTYDASRYAPEHIILRHRSNPKPHCLDNHAPKPLPVRIECTDQIPSSETPCPMS